MPLQLFEEIASLRAHLRQARESGATVGLVPTLGALHAGHGRLIERARHECSRVVVSIFVNPTQFDREEDLARYPRTLEPDLELCRSLGVDVVFSPPVQEMYPVTPVCAVDVAKLTEHLCGRHRPGHFRGVATVVMKLLQIVQPWAAYFGEKDAQQLAVVRRMVAELNVPVTIVGVPTVREADGLALSSRNARLGPDERRLAPLLYGALTSARAAIEAGGTDAAAITADVIAGIPPDPRLKLEYLAIVDADEMQPVERISGPVLVAGALWVGSTRLIDNVHPRKAMTPSGGHGPSPGAGS